MFFFTTLVCIPHPRESRASETRLTDRLLPREQALTCTRTMSAHRVDASRPLTSGPPVPWT